MAAGDDWRHTLPAFCALTNIDWLAVQIQYKYMQYKHRLICDPVHSRHLVDHHQHLAAAIHPLPPPSCPQVSCPALRSPQDPWVICWSSTSSAWCLVYCFDLPDVSETKHWEPMKKIRYEWINSWLPSESSGAQRVVSAVALYPKRFTWIGKHYKRRPIYLGIASIELLKVLLALKWLIASIMDISEVPVRLKDLTKAVFWNIVDPYIE